MTACTTDAISEIIVDYRCRKMSTTSGTRTSTTWAPAAYRHSQRWQAHRLLVPCVRAWTGGRADALASWCRVRLCKILNEEEISRIRCATTWKTAIPNSGRRWRRFCALTGGEDH
jgi:hypothetical protein